MMAARAETAEGMILSTAEIAAWLAISEKTLVEAMLANRC
jgi:hypothetical protein